MAVARHEQVFRLDIAVQDAGVVGRGEGFAEFDSEIKRLSEGQRVVGVGANGLSFEQLLNDVVNGRRRRTVFGSDVEHRGDVRVIQRSRGPGFPVKQGQASRILGQVRRQYLDGHAPAEPGVLGEKHLAHPALAQRLQNSVRSERVASLHQPLCRIGRA